MNNFSRPALVELVFEQPYSRIGNVVSAGIAKRQTASVYLKELCDIGVLREVKGVSGENRARDRMSTASTC